MFSVIDPVQTTEQQFCKYNWATVLAFSVAHSAGGVKYGITVPLFPSRIYCIHQYIVIYACMCSSDCYLIRSIVDDILLSSKTICLCCLLRNGKLGEWDEGTLDVVIQGQYGLRIILGLKLFSPVLEAGHRQSSGVRRYTSLVLLGNEYFYTA